MHWRSTRGNKKNPKANRSCCWFLTGWQKSYREYVAPRLIYADDAQAECWGSCEWAACCCATWQLATMLPRQMAIERACVWVVCDCAECKRWMSRIWMMNFMIYASNACCVCRMCVSVCVCVSVYWFLMLSNLLGCFFFLWRFAILF